MPLIKQHQIIVTRPSPYGERLCQALENAGISSQHLPLIQFSKNSSYSADQQFESFLQADTCIFISQQAVHFSLQSLESSQLKRLQNTGKTIVAVGQATQQALAEYKIEAQIPKRQDSEGILELLQANNTNKSLAKILLIRGNQGRELLEQELPKLAQLQVMSVYQRQASQISWPTSKQHIIHQLIVATSWQLVELSQQKLKQASLNPQDFCLLCPSERIAEQAKKLHFKQIITAPSAADDDIINFCQQWLKH